MPDNISILAARPAFSIVIVAYNDWRPLQQCLTSIAEQENAASFEVVVVDDGSHQPAPEPILQWAAGHPLAILREPHKGIASSRNRGVVASQGDVVLFVDADCKLQKDCLAKLWLAMAATPASDYFQLHLFGERSSVVGRAEELRLKTMQDYALRPDGRIRYLNTAGFAIRRRRIEPGKGLFNPESFRAEDTLLLCDLMEHGELPVFVPEAVVTHAISLSLVECLQKDLRSAPLEAVSFQLIAKRHIPVRMNNRERLEMLSNMWKEAKKQSLGRSAWFVVLARQGLQRLLSSFYSMFPPQRPKGH